MKLRNDPEPLPSNLERIPFPPNFNSLKKRILVKREIDDGASMGLKSIRYVVEGFEDVLGGDTLGAGHFFNTAPTVGQLCYALAISNHPFIGEIPPELTPKKIIEEMRELQVLKDMKILDLGCGRWPAFALTAAALGATVWTVDTDELDHWIKLTRHIIVDLCQEDAAEQLLEKTGGDFDLITEKIIGLVPSNDTRPRLPEEEQFLKIGHALLKSQGHLFCADAFGIMGQGFRKQ